MAAKVLTEANNLSKNETYDVQPNVCPNEHSDRRDAGRGINLMVGSTLDTTHSSGKLTV
jgi:hypothetical protein